MLLPKRDELPVFCELELKNDKKKFENFFKNFQFFHKSSVVDNRRPELLKFIVVPVPINVSTIFFVEVFAKCLRKINTCLIGKADQDP